MLAEEFSFPKVSRSESIKSLYETQSLWRIASGVENGKRDKLGHKSFLEVEGMMRNDKYEAGAEEKMDMLWEDFNNNEFREEEEDCSSLTKCPFSDVRHSDSAELDFDDLSSIAVSRHYDRQTVMSYNMQDDEEFDRMSMVHSKSEMGDLEYLKDKVPSKYGNSLSLKKQNYAMILKVLKKLQKIARVKRRPSLSIN